MTLMELYAQQLEREAAISRRVLERVPEGRNDWKPHEKSMPFGYLATLVATMPSWVDFTIARDELDLKPPGGGGFRPLEWTKNAELRDAHERAVSGALATLRGASDECLAQPWRLLVAGRVVSESPRLDVLADTFTHLAHHRGQLTVYLRLLEVPVPSIYGPSADDRTF